MWKGFLFAAAITVAASIAITSALAAPARNQLLVSPDWLSAHAGDKGLVILAVGSVEDYQAGHIPGARLVAVDGLTVSTADGLSAEMPPPDALRAELATLGISDGSRIVVYVEKGAVPRVTRVLLTLDSAGFGDRAALLDGGLAEWRRTGHTTTTEATQFAVGTLSPLTLKPLIVDSDFVRDHRQAPGYALLDARAPEFFTGEKPDMGSTSGHVPGARNIPFTSVTDANGKYRSPRELRALFTAAGVKPGDHIVAYCHVGMQATAVIYAARILGIPTVLYDGSFQDWSRRGLPVETAPAK
jgi:thiosulfate/3-mercaptopyruvate sulfurtransferase